MIQQNNFIEYRDNIFNGVWDASTERFPVTSNSEKKNIEQSGFWLVTVAGTINSIFYTKGDWVYYDGNGNLSKLSVGGSSTAITEKEALKNYIQSKKVFEYKLDFTPPSVFFSSPQSFGSGLTENEKYIIGVFDDSDGGDYLHHIVMRYNKGTQRIDTKKITTTNSYYGDHHKSPTILITNTGTLLVVIQQLRSIGAGQEDSPLDCFRWTDLDDLDTYSQIVTNLTGWSNYCFIFEVDDDIYIEFRGSADTSFIPRRRAFYKSTDDGATWAAASTWLDYVDTDYWVYSGQVRNNIKNRDSVILGISPINNESSASCYQYVTFLKTDFTNFYKLDGTDLGTTVTAAELEGALSWGNSTKNTSLYFTRTFKIFDNYIWSIGNIGTRISGSINAPNMQIFKVNINTGIVTTGDTFSNIFSPTTLNDGLLFKIGEDIIYKQVYNNDIYYYKFNSDMNGVTLILTETGNYNNYLTTNTYSDLSMDYDTTSGILRVFKMN